MLFNVECPTGALTWICHYYLKFKIINCYHLENRFEFLTCADGITGLAQVLTFSYTSSRMNVVVALRANKTQFEMASTWKQIMLGPDSGNDSMKGGKTAQV